MCAVSLKKTRDVLIFPVVFALGSVGGRAPRRVTSLALAAFMNQRCPQKETRKGRSRNWGNASEWNSLAVVVAPTISTIS